jgi:lipopolysaccharide biosynthesis protein
MHEMKPDMKADILGDAILKKKSAAFRKTDRVALIASYSPDGTIKAHVEYYIRRLSKNGFGVILVIAVDDISDHFSKTDETESDEADFNEIVTSADFVILRENKGFDFGSWAHAFRLFPELYTIKSCLLTNDSLFGPFKSFGDIVSKTLSVEDKVDLFGLTQSNEVLPHIQSYFLHLSNRLLSSESFKYFMDSIQPFANKHQVISLYELPFSFFVQASGFKVGAMFSTSELGLPQFSNPTYDAWRKLIQQGFPFLKIQLLRTNITKVDMTDWKKILHKAGYNNQLAINFLKNNQ